MPCALLILYLRNHVNLLLDIYDPLMPFLVNLLSFFYSFLVRDALFRLDIVLLLLGIGQLFILFPRFFLLALFSFFRLSFLLFLLFTLRVQVFLRLFPFCLYPLRHLSFLQLLLPLYVSFPLLLIISLFFLLPLFSIFLLLL